jgi:hypothetical protein
MSEEFKAIIGLLQGAGVSTLWMFFGYLIFKVLSLVLVLVGTIMGIRTVLILLIKLIHNENRRVIVDLCRMFGFTDYEGDIGYSQRKEMILRVEELKANEEAKIEGDKP